MIYIRVANCFSWARDSNYIHVFERTQRRQVGFRSSHLTRRALAMNKPENGLDKRHDTHLQVRQPCLDCGPQILVRGILGRELSRGHFIVLRKEGA